MGPTMKLYTKYLSLAPLGPEVGLLSLAGPREPKKTVPGIVLNRVPDKLLSAETSRVTAKL